MKKQIIACLIATGAVAAAHAQYTGPGAQTAVTTVKQLTEAGKDDQRVTLRGHIVKSIGDEKYQFADDTGEILVKIDRKRWPQGQPVDDKSTVELTGKYDKELVGASKVKVRSLQVVQ